VDYRQLESEPSFLSPQTGQPETELQVRLRELFQDWPSIRRAYLVKAELNGHDTVLLCLKVTGMPDASLVDDVGKVFVGLFNRSQHLDIMFIRDDQERELAAVCAPFYDYVTGTHSE
jgi:hypothetical protein